MSVNANLYSIDYAYELLGKFDFENAYEFTKNRYEFDASIENTVAHTISSACFKGIDDRETTDLITKVETFFPMQVKISLADKLGKYGFIDKAIELLEELINSKEREQVYAILKRYYRKKGDITKLNELDKEYNFNIGENFDELNKILSIRGTISSEEYLIKLEELYKAQPKFKSVQYELANSYMHNGRVDEAIPLFKDLIDNPTYIQSKLRCMYYLSRCYLDKKEYDLAKETIDLIPTSTVKDDELKLKMLVYKEELYRMMNRNLIGEYISREIYDQYKTRESCVSLGVYAKRDNRLEESFNFFKEAFDLSVDDYERGLALDGMAQIAEKQGRYDEAYGYYRDMKYKYIEYYNAHSKYVDSIDLNLKYYTGNVDSLNGELYYVKQLKNYDKNLAVEHIKLHKEDDIEKEVHTIFAENIDIDFLYDYVLEKISNMHPTDFNTSDLYSINTDFVVNNIDGYDTNKIMVACCLNTKNIITMYPVPLTDYEKYEVDKSRKIQAVVGSKKPKLSAIDKFNQKYGLK